MAVITAAEWTAAAPVLARCEALAEPMELAVGFRYRGIFKDFEAVYEPRDFSFCPCGFTAPSLEAALLLLEARLTERANATG